MNCELGLYWNSFFNIWKKDNKKNIDCVRTNVWLENIYSLRQEKSIVEYYNIVKAKWDDLDYFSEIKWDNSNDQLIFWNRE